MTGKRGETRFERFLFPAKLRASHFVRHHWGGGQGPWDLGSVALLWVGYKHGQLSALASRKLIRVMVGQELVR